MNSQAGEILSEHAPHDPLALTNQLCFSLSVASRMVVQSYRPILEPLGLTHPQYLVMLSLWGASPRTVKDLSSELMQDSATLSPLLKRLESRGLICRDRDPENERALAVTLTDEGRELKEKASQVPVIMMQRLGVTVEQVKELNTAMHRMITQAEEASRA